MTTDSLRDQVAKALHDDECTQSLNWLTCFCDSVNAYKSSADAALKVVADWLRSDEAKEGLPWHADSGIQIRAALADALTKEGEG